MLTPDTGKCAQGHRDFCAPVVRCWDGVEEVSCHHPEKAYHSLETVITNEPPRELEAGAVLHLEWSVNFKNSTADPKAAFETPWISHTNIHAAPAHLGSLRCLLLSCETDGPGRDEETCRST